MGDSLGWERGLEGHRRKPVAFFVGSDEIKGPTSRREREKWGIRPFLLGDRLSALSRQKKHIELRSTDRRGRLSLHVSKKGESYEQCDQSGSGDTIGSAGV